VAKEVGQTLLHANVRLKRSYFGKSPQESYWMVISFGGTASYHESKSHVLKLLMFASSNI